MKDRVLAHKPLLLCFVIYTLVFVIFVRLALYALPFALSLLLAVVMKPLYNFLRRRYMFRSAFTATVITLLIFGSLLAAVGFLLYLIALQAISLFETYGYLLEEYFSSPELLGNIRDAVIAGNFPGALTDIAASLFRAVPLAITFVVITFALTVFFLNRLSELRDGLLDRAGEEYRRKLSAAISTAYLLSRRFIRSYMILYLITFIEAVFIFCLTGVEYPLAFAFITALADILPVLGPGTVYLPFSAFFILDQNYVSGITLAVYFIITVIARQILEPKIVSDTVKVNPLIVLSAIYFSIAAMNIWVLFYIVIFFLLYKVLRAAGILESMRNQE